MMKEIPICLFVFLLIGVFASCSSESVVLFQDGTNALPMVALNTNGKKGLITKPEKSAYAYLAIDQQQLPLFGQLKSQWGGLSCWKEIAGKTIVAGHAGGLAFPCGADGLFSLRSKAAVLAHLCQKLSTTHHEVQDIVVEIQKFTYAAGALVPMRTETVFLEIPAFAVALEATGLEIVRTFKTTLAAFAIVLAERTLLGEILSVLAPIIHVKTCFAMCAALRLARVVVDGAHSWPTPLDA